MSDKLSFQCPACDKICKAPVSMAGKAVNCPACGALIEIPDPSEFENEFDDGVEDYSQAHQDNSHAPTTNVRVNDPNDFGPVYDEPDYESRRGSRNQKNARVASSQGRRRSRDVYDEYDDEGYDDRPRRRRRRKARNTNYADGELSSIELAACFLCSGIACCAGFIYLAQGKSDKGTKMILYSFCAIIFWNVVQFLLVAIGG